MSQFGAQAKNPPWVRSTGQGMPPPMGQQNQLQATSMMSSGLVNAQQLNFQQQQAYQQSLSMQQQQQQAGNAMSQQLQADKNKSYVTVTYPFQTASLSSLGNLGASPMAMHSMQNSLAASSPQGSISYPAPRALQQPGGGFTSQPPPMGNVLPPSAVANAAPTSGLTPKQRVFTGSITKLHDNFGFIDGEVFFQTSVCTKGLAPKVGERALVDAAYNANMPFKWNATRVQVLPSDVHRQNIAAQGFGPNAGYNAVPPPQAFNADDGVFGGGGGDGGRSRSERRRDQRSRDKERDAERERRREDRVREREKEREKEKRSRSPSRRRSRSPRARAASRSPPRRRPRAIPRYVVQVPKISLDLPEANVLELKRRYTNMYVPSDFFTTRVRWVDAFPANRPITMNRPCSFHVMHKDVEGLTENLSVLEPADADYSFSAKVMLMSLPGLEEVYRKSCALAEDMKEGETRNGYVHPTRLINFLVGVRGKNETMAIGGPWSPSLDGINPESDSQVLIRTAIRTCKALTGVDLSSCTQWYRFVEIYYRRGESTHKGKAVPARVETVVLFLPDVWSCVPTRLEWDSLQASYKKQLLRKLKDEQDNTAGGSNGAANGAVDDQKDEKSSDVENEKKPEPKHFSELDPKSMKVSDLRQELEARSLSSKGLKSQLVARLSKTLKTEQDVEESGEKSASDNQQLQTQSDSQAEKDQAADKMEVDTEPDDKKKKEDDEKREERERQARERRFALPDMPHILVHPSRTAKSGKFDCTVMSLSLLLDYRQEDAKEHSFEVSLFAELFNEMLMRDFGFRIYRALADAPERPKEDDKERKDKPKGKDKEKDSSSSKKKEPESKKDKEKKDEDEEADEDLEEDDEEEVEEESNASSSSKKKDDKSKDKKKEKIKMVTTDPGLLLAFVYFDQTHCGYIFDKDIEEILCTLGLNLSRAQCRKMLQKVVTRDTLNYRKLTDKPKDNVPTSDEGIDSAEEAKHQQMLAAGNKTLLPVFADINSSLFHQINTSASGEMPVVPDGGVVLYCGGVVDISKLLLQLERSEKSRISTEDTVVQLQTQLGKSKEIIKEEAAEITKLKIDLKNYRHRAEQAESELSICEETLSSVRTGLSEFRESVSKLEQIVQVKTMKTTTEVKMEEVDKEEEPHKIQEVAKDTKEEEGDSK